jgi:hypothetical protein
MARALSPDQQAALELVRQQQADELAQALRAITGGTGLRLAAGVGTDLVGFLYGEGGFLTAKRLTLADFGIWVGATPPPGGLITFQQYQAGAAGYYLWLEPTAAQPGVSVSATAAAAALPLTGAPPAATHVNPGSAAGTAPPAQAPVTGAPPAVSSTQGAAAAAGTAPGVAAPLTGAPPTVTLTAPQSASGTAPTANVPLTPKAPAASSAQGPVSTGTAPAAQVPLTAQAPAASATQGGGGTAATFGAVGATVLSYNPSAALPMPAGLAANQLLVAVVSSGGPAPSGWTRKLQSTYADISVYYRIARVTASEVSSGISPVTFTGLGAAAAGFVFSINGCPTSGDPFKAAAAAYNSVPTLTGLAVGDLVVAAFGGQVSSVEGGDVSDASIGGAPPSAPFSTLIASRVGGQGYVDDYTSARAVFAAAWRGTATGATATSAAEPYISTAGATQSVTNGSALFAFLGT